MISCCVCRALRGLSSQFPSSCSLCPLWLTPSRSEEDQPQRARRAQRRSDFMTAIVGPIGQSSCPESSCQHFGSEIRAEQEDLCGVTRFSRLQCREDVPISCGLRDVITKDAKVTNNK